MNQGDVAGAISSFYGVPSSDPSVVRLLALILPDVARASSADPRSWKSVIPGILAKYESAARDMGLGISPAQRAIEAAKNANPTAAGPVGLDHAQAALRLAGSVPLAMRDGGGSCTTGERASNAAITRDSTLTVNGAITFARDIGANPALAGLFAGGSPEMRDALRGAVQNGTAIADDKIKSMNDVGVVLGAIRAGKLAADDPRIPDSVKRIVEDMRAKGIDPKAADQKAIKKYLNENPDALNKARQQGLSDEQRNKRLSQGDLAAKVENATDVATADKKQGAAKKVLTATTTL